MLKLTQELANMSLVLQTKVKNLKTRALLLRKARDFFFDRNILEVDCPIITKYASIDTHIDLMPVTFLGNETRYLHSSPEYGMKRLLSLEIGDIYQLSHVFRDEGFGKKHNPEFMMAEWYRTHMNFDEIIKETIDFIKLFLGDLPSSTLSYRDAFKKYAGIDYLTATVDDLFNYLEENKIEAYPAIKEEGKDALLNLILGTVIEKELGKNEILALIHYPESQASLARTVKIGDEIVAKRFEIYYQGIELANGYHELIQNEEQEKRFVEANVERIKLNKKPYPIDRHLLDALKKGIPDCSGVAVGFDRLMMLHMQAENIEEVIPFGWTEA